MNEQLWRLVERADSLSPAATRRVISAFLRYASPFNGPLRARVDVWRPHLCRIRVANRRALHNHLGGIHAGALVTAGETPAGLLILRSFPFDRYRPILKDLSVQYERQARTDLVCEVRISDEALAAATEGILRGPQLVALETSISEPSGARLALVKTTWQVKSWSQVRSR